MALVPKILLAITALGLGYQAKTPTAKPTPKEVAGDYYFGDGLGVNCGLKLTQDGKFSFKWTGCLGVYDQNSGPYHFEGDELVLDPTKTNDRDGFRGTATRFYPVHWGKRLYLIAEEDMAGFCHAIAVGWDGSSFMGVHGDHYVRLEGNRDELPPVSGLPEVPAKFRSLLKADLVAHVTNVTKGVIHLDKGREDGLAIGTKLCVGKQAFRWIVITKLSDHTSEARMWDKTDRIARVGDRLSAFDVEAIHPSDVVDLPKKR